MSQALLVANDFSDQNINSSPKVWRLSLSEGPVLALDATIRWSIQTSLNYAEVSNKGFLLSRRNEFQSFTKTLRDLATSSN